MDFSKVDWLHVAGVGALAVIAGPAVLAATGIGAGLSALGIGLTAGGLGLTASAISASSQAKGAANAVK